jgi:hypothetical protein
MLNRQDYVNGDDYFIGVNGDGITKCEIQLMTGNGAVSRSVVLRQNFTVRKCQTIGKREAVCVSYDRTTAGRKSHVHINKHCCREIRGNSVREIQ